MNRTIFILCIVLCLDFVIGKSNYKPRVVAASGYIYSQIGNHKPSVIYLTRAENNHLKVTPFRHPSLPVTHRTFIAPVTTSVPFASLTTPVPLTSDVSRSRNDIKNPSPTLNKNKIFDFELIHNNAAPKPPPTTYIQRYPGKLIFPFKIHPAFSFGRKPNCCHTPPKSVPMKPIEKNPPKKHHESTSTESSKKSHKSRESSEESSSKEWSEGSSEEHSHKDSGKTNRNHSEEKKHLEKEHKTEKNGGSSFNEEDRKRKGFEDTEGYKNFSTFSKGRKKKYSEEDHSEYSDEEKSDEESRSKSKKGEKKKHSEQIKEGGKLNEQKNLRKGSKTLGYHNVLHKDEYKKKRTFYDDYDDRGFFKLFGILD